MLWMIDNGIHDLLLCASISTCRLGVLNSRFCHAAARGSARPSLPPSDFLIIRSENHSLDDLWVKAAFIERSYPSAHVMYIPLACSWRIKRAT